MKVIKRDELITMPAGTVYQEFTEHVLGGICIKDDTCAPGGEPIDWFFVPIPEPSNGHTDTMLSRFDLASGMSVGIDFETVERDGLFNASQLYAVWEKRDVRGLIDRLELAIKGYDTNTGA